MTTTDGAVPGSTNTLSTPHSELDVPSRSDRLAKYNQLLRIAEELGPAARFAGVRALAR